MDLFVVFLDYYRSLLIFLKCTHMFLQVNNLYRGRGNMSFCITVLNTALFPKKEVRGSASLRS